MPALVRKAVSTVFRLLHNRSELFAIEAQEEKSRLIAILMYGLGAVLLGLMTLLLVTAIVIFAVAEPYRMYVAAGFALLYFLGALAAVLAIRTNLKRTPFAETVDQFKKDRELLETME